MSTLPLPPFELSINLLSQAVNAPRDQSTRLAISAANQATFPETAPTLLLRALDVVAAVVDFQPVVVELKSATRYISISLELSGLAKYFPCSAERSVTSHVTAQKLVDTVEVVVDTVANKADTAVVDSVAVVVKADKLATLAVVTATCLVRFSPFPKVLHPLTAPR